MHDLRTPPDNSASILPEWIKLAAPVDRPALRMQ
jgi:hypothetical protein